MIKINDLGTIYALRTKYSGNEAHSGLRILMCVGCHDNRIFYSREHVVDIDEGMILVKNITLGLSSMGTGDPCIAIKRSFVTAIGRVIEAPSGGGRELVSRTIFYRPRAINGFVCPFSPGDPGDAIEISGPGSQGVEGLIAMEAQLALNYSRISGPAPLVIGGGFEAYTALYVLQSVGLRASTLGRTFRGVDVINLSRDTAIERSFSSIYIAGIADEDERKIIRILASRGKINIYYHPLLAGEEISIPLGDKIRIRSLGYSRPRLKAIELSRRIRRAAKGYKYLEARFDEEPPLYTDLLLLSTQDTNRNKDLLS